MFKTLLETTLFLSFDLALDGDVFEDAIDTICKNYTRCLGKVSQDER